MRALVAQAFLAVALVAVLLAAPLAMADDAAIRAVIEDQIADFQKNDLDGAFSHAAPSIQGKFGSPARFGQMVQSGYPMIWRPKRYEMLGLSETVLGQRQTVLFEDQNGAFWEADYTMRLIDGTWRIAGVTLRRAPGVAS
ncbi:MAG: DUF4864 domain-containing protein [Pseudomonadota bacterium]